MFAIPNYAGESGWWWTDSTARQGSARRDPIYPQSAGAPLAADAVQIDKSSNSDTIDIGFGELDWSDCQQAVQGNSDAYERLVERYQGLVASQMWRFTRDKNVFEELVQNAFVEAYLSLSSYRGDGCFGNWLRKIAVRVGYKFWKDRARNQKTARLSDGEWDRLESTESTLKSVEAAEAGAVVYTVLEQLPPRDRLVLTLLYIDGHSVAEAAGLVGWSQTMVKVQAFRARGKLKKLLERGQSDRDKLEQRQQKSETSER